MKSSWIAWASVLAATGNPVVRIFDGNVEKLEVIFVR
jgi:hypothetical protein